MPVLLEKALAAAAAAAATALRQGAVSCPWQWLVGKIQEDLEGAGTWLQGAMRMMKMPGCKQYLLVFCVPMMAIVFSAKNVCVEALTLGHTPPSSSAMSLPFFLLFSGG